MILRVLRNLAGRSTSMSRQTIKSGWRPFSTWPEALPDAGQTVSVGRTERSVPGKSASRRTALQTDENDNLALNSLRYAQPVNTE